MESEHVVLSTAIFFVQEVASSMVWNYTNILLRKWGDNAGPKVLANLKPPRMTQISPLEVKYHWLRKRITPEKIELANN